MQRISDNRVKADIENQLKGHSEYRFTIDAKEKLIKKNEDVVLPETFLKDGLWLSMKR